MFVSVPSTHTESFRLRMCVLDSDMYKFQSDVMCSKLGSALEAIMVWIWISFLWMIKYYSDLFISVPCRDIKHWLSHVLSCSRFCKTLQICTVMYLSYIYPVSSLEMLWRSNVWIKWRKIWLWSNALHLLMNPCLIYRGIMGRPSWQNQKWYLHNSVF